MAPLYIVGIFRIISENVLHLCSKEPAERIFIEPDRFTSSGKCRQEASSPIPLHIDHLIIFLFSNSRQQFQKTANLFIFLIPYQHISYNGMIG